MEYSNIALLVLAAKECGIIGSSAQFWERFPCIEKFNAEVSSYNKVIKIADQMAKNFDSAINEGFICAYDKAFPVINRKVNNKGDKPYLLFYRGDISLLSNLNKNVAVIGLINPDDEIRKREIDIVGRLVRIDQIVVSGLAIGCDTIAHKVSLETGGKTIAILPSQLNKIYPSENRNLADEIVNQGGLLISEYYKAAVSRYEAVNRFIERDRLQAMFSKAIIMIASYKKGQGDSGSRHAMEAARKYEVERYVMYNEKTDGNNEKFALNKDLIKCNGTVPVKILTQRSIEYLDSYTNPNLLANGDPGIGDQITLFN